MFTKIKKSLIIFLIITFCFSSFGTMAFAEGENLDDDNTLSAERIVVDLFFVRPLGIASTVLGSAVFIISLPFSTLGGNAKEVFNTVVVEPAAFSFTRPLGEF